MYSSTSSRIVQESPLRRKRTHSVSHETVAKSAYNSTLTTRSSPHTQIVSRNKISNKTVYYCRTALLRGYGEMGVTEVPEKEAAAQ